MENALATSYLLALKGLTPQANRAAGPPCLLIRDITSLTDSASLQGSQLLVAVTAAAARMLNFMVCPVLVECFAKEMRCE